MQRFYATATVCGEREDCEKWTALKGRGSLPKGFPRLPTQTCSNPLSPNDRSEPMSRRNQIAALAVIGIAVCFHLGCSRGPHHNGTSQPTQTLVFPSPDKGPEDMPDSRTPFAADLFCSIVEIHQLRSGERTVLIWTDGIGSFRVNMPVDLYIDTDNAID